MAGLVFSKGDRVKIVGPSVTGRRERSGETHTVVYPRIDIADLDCEYPCSYPNSSLELVSEWTPTARLKFFEAVEHLRKHGGRVRYCGQRVNPIKHHHEIAWYDGAVRWCQDGIPAHLWDVAHVDRTNLDGEWMVVAPNPPKQYDFSEAYQMMKAGKWMKPDHPDCRSWKFQNGTWHSCGLSCDAADSADFSTKIIDMKWVEDVELAKIA